MRSLCSPLDACKKSTAHSQSPYEMYNLSFRVTVHPRTISAVKIIVDLTIRKRIIAMRTIPAFTNAATVFAVLTPYHGNSVNHNLPPILLDPDFDFAPPAQPRKSNGDNWIAVIMALIYPTKCGYHHEFVCCFCRFYSHFPSLLSEAVCLCCQNPCCRIAV